MNPIDIQKDFQLNGYFVARNVIPKHLLLETLQSILKTIQSCSKETEVSQTDYLSSVSRWGSPSPITSAVPQTIIKYVSQETQSLLKDVPLLSKFNIICKNEFCREPVPFHQDISYSPENPYQVSAWLALEDVCENAGALEVIPGSHKQSIEPAVDFWSPEYRADPFHKKNALKLPLSAGDIVFFDSSLWHGSSESLAKKSRYALVTRWTTQAWLPPLYIPPIEPRDFGMWTCGEQTQQILSQAAHFLFGSQEQDILKLLELWEDRLQRKSFTFIVDQNVAIESLKRIKILHRAYLKHNGGDATGTLYKNLWKSFLCPLRNYIDNVVKREAI